MNKSRWISYDPKEFVAGDIICNKELQDFIRLVVYVDDVALWCVGLVHCALSENCNPHPLFPMYFDEIEKGVWEPLLRIGNLNDYSNYINSVQNEILASIKNIKECESEN